MEREIKALPTIRPRMCMGPRPSRSTDLQKFLNPVLPSYQPLHWSTTSLGSLYSSTPQNPSTERKMFPMPWSIILNASKDQTQGLGASEASGGSRPVPTTLPPCVWSCLTRFQDIQPHQGPPSTAFARNPYLELLTSSIARSVTRYCQSSESRRCRRRPGMKMWDEVEISSPELLR
jgi:hypothetical protein